MIKIFIKDGQKYAKVSQLHKWKDNPKDAKGEDLQRLESQLELGEHSAFLITPDGEVLGGNTRLSVYRKSGKREAKVIMVEFRKKGDIVEAFVDGVKAGRKFQSVEQGKLEYALSHNDMVGTYNETKLQNLLALYPIPTEMFKISTVVRPLTDVANEAGITAPEDRAEDEDTQDTEALDSYMHGAIKQIVLFFDNAQYENVIPRLEALRGALSLENNTELFLQMVKISEDYVREQPSPADS